MGNVPAPCVGNVPGALHGKCPRRTKHPAREFCACAGISKAHNAQSPLRCAKAGDHNCIVIIKNPRRKTIRRGFVCWAMCIFADICFSSERPLLYILCEPHRIKVPARLLLWEPSELMGDKEEADHMPRPLILWPFFVSGTSFIMGVKTLCASETL